MMRTTRIKLKFITASGKSHLGLPPDCLKLISVRITRGAKRIKVQCGCTSPRLLLIKKKEEGTNAVYKQAADKGVLDFNGKCLIKQEPAYQRAGHKQLAGNIGEGVGKIVNTGRAFKQMIIKGRIAVVHLPQNMR